MAAVEPTVRDPNTLPFMPPPAGQPRAGSQRWMRWDEAQTDRTPRFRVTVEPLYAAFRASFIGRSAQDLIHGGGFGIMGDVTLPWSLGLRARASYSGHRLPSVYEDGEEGPVLAAPAGRLDNVEIAGALLYALDLGRVTPILELGVGSLWIRTPTGVQPGQRGQPCLTGGQCDVGLSCQADLQCRPRPSITVHGGIAVDMTLHRRVALGVGFRYFAFISAPGVFPVYLHASARATVRF